MPLPAIPDALSKGTIDGCVIPWEVVPSVKVHELTKFHSEFDKAGGALYTTTFVMGMNKAKYDSLPPDLKKVIDDNSGMATSGLAGQGPAGQRPGRPQGGRRPQEHDLHRSPRPTPRNSSARRAWSRWNGCKTWTSAASTARSSWRPPAP